MLHRLVTGMRVFWRKRFGVLPLRNSLTQLGDWFASPLGQLLVEKEQVLIEESLHNLFGYHLMQLSISGQLDLVQASRISHKFSLHPSVQDTALFSAVADYNHLPLPPHSLDVVVLHHVLDYSQSPHHVLREASSVLISQGHLVLVGFNPWSLFGCWRWLARLFTTSPQWRHQSLRLGRVLDWLAVLDFEPMEIKQGFYLPPCKNPKVIKYLHWMDSLGKQTGLRFGGFYIIVARKDTLAVTPIKPQWQQYAGLRGWGVIRILGRATREISYQAQHKNKMP